MMTKCPECDSKVSDRALYCPHCGNPLLPTTPTARRTKTKQRMRLPNGFGQISEIKNRNLRKPFRAMVTVGIEEDGRPICKPLKPTAYFAAYNEAYSALVAHNSNPYDVSMDTTMQELYEMWYPEYSVGKAYTTLIGTQNAWRWCESISTMKVKDVRVRHIKGCLDKAETSANNKGKMKQVLNMMFDYALIYELTDKNYSRMYVTGHRGIETDDAKNSHITYTDSEMELLWSIEGQYMTADMTLVQCYSGWRPGELFKLKVDDIDLDEMTYTGGSKTKAGIGRIVPIHSKVESIVRRYYTKSVSNGNMYLFPGPYGRQMLHPTFRKDFDAMIDTIKINPDHRPHDGRVRFVTSAKEENVNEYAIKYFVGHKIRDLTEGTYTKRNLLWLKGEMEKVK